MNTKLVDEMSKLIHDLEVLTGPYSESGSPFGPEIMALIPSIAETLRQLKSCITAQIIDETSCNQLLKGLARLSLEYVEFTDSEYGKRIGGVHNGLQHELGRST